MKIPHDDILEGLYKFRIPESEKLKTVLELYDLETHQKKLEPDYHRWKNYGEKKYRARNSKSEFRGQKWKFWEERRGQESGNKTACTKNSWRLLAVGIQRAVCERRQLQFSPRYNKRGKVTPSNPSQNSFMQQSERKSSRTRTKSQRQKPQRWNVSMALQGWITSEELVTTHFVKNGTPPECLFYKTKSGCRFGEKCSFAHRQVDEQPTKRFQKNDDKVLRLCWRKVIGKKENLLPMNVTIHRGNLGREVIRNWDKIHLNVDHLMHGNWVVYPSLPQIVFELSFFRPEK